MKTFIYGISYKFTLEMGGGERRDVLKANVINSKRSTRMHINTSNFYRCFEMHMMYTYHGEVSGNAIRLYAFNKFFFSF